MKYIDYKVVQALQERVFEGEERALSLLYMELRRIADAMLPELGAPAERIAEFSHDAATSLVSQYLKHPGYRIRNGHFGSRMRIECLAALRERSLNPSGGYPDREITRARANTIPLDNVSVSVASESVEEDDPDILDRLSDYFQRFRWFRPALRGLAPYLPKRWLFDHAVQLRMIFQEAQNGKGAAKHTR